MENNNSSFFNLRDYDFNFNRFQNKIGVLIIVLAVLVFLLFFSNLGNSKLSTEGENRSNYNYTGLFITIIIIVLLILGVKYYYDNVIKKKDDDTKEEESESEEEEEEAPQKKEVFNIAENIYTYKQANEVCKAYDSKLANYEQLEKAYNDGAEWCNYGWSDDQSILFPTQKTTYDNLQKIKGHEHDCGRQGVNGGYMEDSELKFGVNCFGYKPKIKLKEADLMKNTTPYPKTKEEEKFNEDVENLKKNMDDIIISPFNYKMWSRF